MCFKKMLNTVLIFPADLRIKFADLRRFLNTELIRVYSQSYTVEDV